MIDRNDIHWYRDAIIYQLHVKSFFDSGNDGIGDFKGLTQKLDYIKNLGATAIWLMPFYPSPLRDDGYDIADYRNINSAYGTLRDFKHFIHEAHLRDLRVITELVVNHTSDQHPWFQKARAAKPGSAARNFYVWSDNDRRYKDAGIIFLDIEKSNWTWDEEAKAFYWHRFYSHQPDLNYDNPRVLEAVLEIMYFWLEMGVDGLRLDAIPYLVEREGTNCDNLPETHAIIKKIRAALDARYQDRMLLAEANLWPEDTAQYFGNGDECHMAFHFPLMPRIYMALAQEDRHPITDIMRQTPDIPEGAQWAIFLRNHDEMTLAMVTDKERDYLWSFYAADARARINLGIRRRLAPLLANDRRKIELLNSLLHSMPGTPFLYYGDEIGMGDNIYLGDRDGVRTPMQWSVDRNGGFSRSDPARLFLPVIQDPTYGYSAINVEAQLASTTSLLNWTRRLIAVRRAHKAFARGSLRFLYPANRRVLAYLRMHDGETILCVVNISGSAQAMELDLSEFRGVAPIELMGGSVFPPISSAPYLLTLAAYGFFWFRLEKIEAMTKQEKVGPEPELFTLVATGKLETILRHRERIAFERTIAPRFLASRPWFSGAGHLHGYADEGRNGSDIAAVDLRDFAILRDQRNGRFVLPILDVTFEDGGKQVWFTPLAAEAGIESDDILIHAAARLRRVNMTGLLFEADASPVFPIALVEAMRRGDVLPTEEGGSLVFQAREALALRLTGDLALQDFSVRLVEISGGDRAQVLANRMIVKLCRHPESGVNPQVESSLFLTDVAGFKNVPALLGTLDHVAADGTRTTLLLIEAFIRGQGNAWNWTVHALKRVFEAQSLTPTATQSELASTDSFATYLPYMQRLGQRTAELHKALAVTMDDGAFIAETMSLDDVEAEVSLARECAMRGFSHLEKLVRQDNLAEDIRTACGDLLARREECLGLIDDLCATPIGAIKIRIHGRYHLDQLLVVKDDIIIVGFEADGTRSAAWRRAKASPLRDIADMVRSFAYAVETARRDLVRQLPGSTAASRLKQERIRFSRVFIEAYMEAAKGSIVWIKDDATRSRLLRLFLLSKAFASLEEEVINRPDWVDLPIEGIVTLLEAALEIEG